MKRLNHLLLLFLGLCFSWQLNAQPPPAQDTLSKRKIKIPFVLDNTPPLYINYTTKLDYPGTPMSSCWQASDAPKDLGLEVKALHGDINISFFSPETGEDLQLLAIRERSSTTIVPLREESLGKQKITDSLEVWGIVDMGNHDNLWLLEDTLLFQFKYQKTGTPGIQRKNGRVASLPKYFTNKWSARNIIAYSAIGIGLGSVLYGSNRIIGRPKVGEIDTAEDDYLAAGDFDKSQPLFSTWEGLIEEREKDIKLGTRYMIGGGILAVGGTILHFVLKNRRNKYDEWLEKKGLDNVEPSIKLFENYQNIFGLSTTINF